ncbi:hypothetical protein NDA10_000929 [Ustilago hordei]|nr:hypothetical protein NDA10_000929 [Ustilago hordei]UTT87984.1 hypothetical protein NDA17_006239 [Ustilago hordei]
MLPSCNSPSSRISVLSVNPIAEDKPEARLRMLRLATRSFVICVVRKPLPANEWRNAGFLLSRRKFSLGRFRVGISDALLALSSGLQQKLAIANLRLYTERAICNPLSPAFESREELLQKWLSRVAYPDVAISNSNSSSVESPFELLLFFLNLFAMPMFAISMFAISMFAIPCSCQLFAIRPTVRPLAFAFSHPLSLPRCSLLPSVTDASAKRSPSLEQQELMSLHQPTHQRSIIASSFATQSSSKWNDGVIRG